MKNLMGISSLLSLGAGTFLLELEMLLNLRAGLTAIIAVVALAAVGRALHRAPPGEERTDGFHCERTRSRVFATIRRSQDQIRQGWT